MKKLILTLLTIAVLSMTGCSIPVENEKDIVANETVSSVKLTNEQKEFIAKMFASTIKHQHLGQCIVPKKTNRFH